jgi:hypothetical protein
VALIFSISIAQSRNLATQQSRNLATQQSRNLATQQSRNLAKQQLRNLATQQSRKFEAIVSICSQKDLGIYWLMFVSLETRFVKSWSR